MPIERCADFVDWFLTNVPIEPIWLCPLRLRDRPASWPLYPIRPHHTYVNVGFWSSVPVGATEGRDEPADRAQGQRARRAQVAVLRRLLLPRRIRRTLRRGDVQDRKEDLRSRFTAPRPLFEGGAATMTTFKEHGPHRRPGHQHRRDGSHWPRSWRSSPPVSCPSNSPPTTAVRRGPRTPRSG